MTIAVGFPCKDGFVFAADRQMSHGTASDFGSFSHYEEKVFGIDSVSFSALLCGSGRGDLIRSFAEAFFANLSEGEDDETATYLSLNETRNILESTLNDFAAKINEVPDLSFLVAVARGGAHQFLRSDGLIIRSAGPLPEILGIGETSLVRYLIDSMYSPDLGSLYAICLAVFVVYAAKKYCPQYCGGLTDVHLLSGSGDVRGALGACNARTALEQEQVKALESLFEQRAEEHLLNLIDEAAELLKRK